MLILTSMEFVRRLFLYVTILSMLFLVIGLFKPWMMLWWEDIQNRKKVIRVYGTAAVVSYLLYWCFLLL
jgi:hypothetical protein